MEKGLTMGQRILVAGTLFGMFFGAGNLIFPVHLGQLAGRNAIPAMIGFILSAVGIPILGVAAIGITHSDGLQALASKVGRGYGCVFTALVCLTIGPFSSIPRCATTSYTAGIEPMLGAASGSGALLVFSLLFFAAVLLMSLHPGGVIMWIGKVINPLFLGLLAILVVSALARPGAPIAQVDPHMDYQSGTLFSGFIQGYGTMDAVAGLVFGVVVVDAIRSMGVGGDGAVARDVLGSGLLTGLLMALIYVAVILMGAQSRGLFEISENGGIALARISAHYLGRWGSLVMALTILLACLKTAIGLVASCADLFCRLLPKGPSYKGWAVIFTAVSFAISNVGLSAIIAFSEPALMFLYPLTITLILLALGGKLFHHARQVYVSVTLFTGAAAFLDMVRALPAHLREGLGLNGLVSLGERMLPWFSLNLGWITPALAGLILGLGLYCLGRRK